MTKSKLAFALVLVLAVGLAVGCVTNKKFDTTVADMTTRVDGVQTKVEAQSARIDKLENKDKELQVGIDKVGTEANAAKGDAANAMTKAVAAEKAAKGKVIWQVTLTNKDVRFDSDKAEMTDAGKAALDQLAAKLKTMDKMVFVEVQGHTDDRGSDQLNTALGQKRADVVRAYLHEKVIPLNLISAISYGKTRPIADNKTKDGRAQNRRVEVLVLE